MALIDELKERRKRQTESLATIYEAIRERQEYLRGVEFELEDLDRAIAALQPPAQPHGELRTAPPAAVENSGDISFADVEKIAERMESERRLLRMKEALNSSDQQTEDSALGYSSGNDQGDGMQAPPGGVKESRDQSQDFTLLDPAVLRDEPEIPEGASFDTSNWQLEGNNFLAEQEAKAEPEVEGYAPVVDAEAVLDATELAQVTIDKVPQTAEVIKDKNGRAKFALFGGQTHEVVEPSNTEADFWARALFPKKKEQA